jgi:CBS domain-containing protein
LHSWVYNTLSYAELSKNKRAQVLETSALSSARDLHFPSDKPGLKEPKNMNGNAKISSVMSSKLLSVAPTDDASDAFNLMDSAGVKHLPVLQDGELVGILSRSDFTSNNVIDMGTRRASFSNCKVRELMVDHPATITSDETLEDAREVMEEAGIHCLPVMQGSQLIGMITSSDFFKEGELRADEGLLEPSNRDVESMLADEAVDEGIESFADREGEDVQLKPAEPARGLDPR